jgi:hypothetical protein
VSHIHIQRLAAIRSELIVVREGVRCLKADWPRLHAQNELEGARFQDIQEAERNLEATYIVRLFSEFEAILQAHLTLHYPNQRLPGTAEALINRMGARRRIPDAIRLRAHTVREYRNAVVHQRATVTAALAFAHALSRLNHFLAPLPD